MKLADAVRTIRQIKVSHVQSFAQHVIPEVARPARVIWNQAIAGVFLLFALSFAGYALFQSRNPAGMIGGLFLGLVMGFFCVTSYLKARQISRR